MPKSTRSYAPPKKDSSQIAKDFRSFLLMQQFAAREIGQRIAQARRESGGMTQPDLAEALNISTRSLQDYEAGVTIPWKHFQMLSSIFDRPLAWFIHGEEPETQATGIPSDPRELAALEDLATRIEASAQTIAAESARIAGLLAAQAVPPAQSERK